MACGLGAGDAGDSIKLIPRNWQPWVALAVLFALICMAIVGIVLK